MTGCSVGRRPPGVRLGTKTVAGAAGLCLFLAGIRASAQTSLGAPVPVTEPAGSAAGAVLSAPRDIVEPGDMFPRFGAPPLSLPLVETDYATTRPVGPPPPSAKAPAKVHVQAVLAQERVPLGARNQGVPAGTAYDEGRPPFPPMIRLDVPGAQVLFRLESEEELRARMRQEAMQRERGKQLYFPDASVVMSSDKSPPPRRWPEMVELVERADVGFRRLWFHQINFDRYGWDLGVFQPAVATGTFYFDILTLPIQFMMDPWRRWEYNTGWYLPGDPAPLALYPLQPK